MKPRAATACDVCEHFPPNSGSLKCGHEFCKDCFERFVNGSLDELNKALRCCICGNNSLLTRETRQEIVSFCFGREAEPKLQEPNGLTIAPDSKYISFDKLRKRGYIFGNGGNILLDFAFVYQTSPMDGIAVTKDGLIIAPFVAERKNTIVAYFTSKGGHLTSTYINKQENDCDISSLAVNSKNWVAVADRSNSAIHLLHPIKRHTKSLKIDRLIGEQQPKPAGVTFNSNDDLIVTDESNHCIKMFDSEGNFLFKSGSFGERPGQFISPEGVTVDSGNRIFVADRGNGRVQILAPDGSFIRYLVRLNRGKDVYLAPKDIVCLSGMKTAVLLTGTRDAPAAEVRIYPYCLEKY